MQSSPTFRRFACVSLWIAGVLASGARAAAGASPAGSAGRERVLFASSGGGNRLEERDMPPLPRKIRGAFVGSVGGAIVVAGGVEDVPATGAPETWPLLDTVYVLPPPSNATPPDARSTGRKVLDWVRPLVGVARARRVEKVEVYGPWQLAKARLDRPTAFGASAVHTNTLVCLGGYTSAGATPKVFRIGYAKGEAFVEPLGGSVPDLPAPRAFHAAQTMGGSLYVVGGMAGDGQPALSGDVLTLEFPRVVSKGKGLLGPLNDWANRRKAAQERKGAMAWKAVQGKNANGAEVSPLDGGLLKPLLDVRRDEGTYRDALYVFGGRRAGGAAGAYAPTVAVWKYIPGEEARAGWRRLGDLPAGIEVSGSTPLGPSHLVVLGRKTPKAGVTLNEWAAEGGGGNGFLYHTYTDTWVSLENRPFGTGATFCPLGSSAAWLGLQANAGGESAPAARRVEVTFVEKPFGVANALVVYGFFGVLVAIGYLCRKKDATTEEYFLSGHKIPWWASGLSMWATGVSAISLMAIPAKTYATDWSYMWLGIFPPVMLSLSAMVFMPIFRRLKIMSMTEYFEMRFDPSIRVLSSFLTVLGHTGAKMSITLLVPSLALSAVTGWDVYFCVAVMGLVTIVYTVVGGMDAVIWTDVAQSVIMVVAPILTIGIIIGRLGGGFGEFLSVGADHAKFRLLDASPDLTVATFWVFAIWSVTQLFGVLGQETMQRAWATDGVKAAKKSVYTLAAVSLPGTILFYSIGTSLYAYYRQHPDELNPTIQTDGIFPHYIVQSLPAGVSGLMIAAIIAAAISMAMNTSSTVVTRDFFRFFFRDASDKTRMRFGWWGTLISGLIATGLAVFLASFKSSSLWDLFSKLMALVGGGFGGVIVLGLLTKRASTAGAWIGSLVGTGVLIYLEVFTRISFFIYGTVALAVSVGVGYLASRVFPDRPRNLEGLTIWTLPKD
jgi:SSS family solute:Na+ symporter